MHTIIPVILSGGAGTRLWPLSRQSKPKQFHAFGGQASLFAETAKRFSGKAHGVEFAAPIIVCNAGQVDAARAALTEVGITPAAFLLEPVGRNTAPAALAAAAHAAVKKSDVLLLLTPSDHVVGDPEKFHAAIAKAALAAVDGRIVTFGIEPTGADTGYGYIRRGAALPADGVFAIDRFEEKPKPERAEAMLKESGWMWNAGVFLFRADILLREAESLAADTLEPARMAVKKAVWTGDSAALDADYFARCPSVPIDIAIMEKTAHGAVAPVSPKWSDVGSWSALWDIAAKDSAGNAGVGLFVDSKNCLVETDGPLVALLGVEDLAVVVSDGAILVLPKKDAQRVRDIVDALKSRDPGKL